MKKLWKALWKTMGLSILMSVLLFSISAFAGTKTIHYMLNGEFWKMENHSDGAGVPLATVSVGEGITFDGWYTNADYTGTKVSVVNTLTSGQTVYGRTRVALTFMHSWDSTSLIAHGYVNQKVEEAKRYDSTTIGTNWPQPEYGAYGSDYTFLGWFTESEPGAGTEIYKNDTITADMQKTFYDHKFGYLIQPSDVSGTVGSPITINWSTNEKPDKVILTRIVDGHETNHDLLTTENGLNALATSYTFTPSEPIQSYYKIIIYKTAKSGEKSVYSNSFKITANEAPKAKYNVTVKVSPENSGALTSGSTLVTESSLTKEYEEGASIQLKAEFAKGYEFVEWQDESGKPTTYANAALLTYPVSGAKTFTAVFKKAQYTLDVKATTAEGGTVLGPDGKAVTLPYTVSRDYMTSETYTAQAADGYEFVEWQDESGAKVTDAASYAVKYEANAVLNAVFKKKAEALTPGGETPGAGTSGSETPGSGTPGGETPVPGAADESVPVVIKTGTKIESKGLSYTVKKDGSVKFTGVADGVKPAKVTVPAVISKDGKEFPVTEIAASAFKGSKTLKKITIGKNVTKIGKNAFINCKKLVTVKGCTGVTSIGANAFYGCTKLVTVGNKTKFVTLPKIKTIGDKAFSKCSSILQVNLTSKALTKIGKQAFLKCTSMVYFAEYSKNLKSLGQYIFYADSKLESMLFATKLLTSSNVARGVFKGISPYAEIMVSVTNVASYNALFKEKGAPASISVVQR